VTRYVPLRLKGWMYRLHRAKEAVMQSLGRLAKRARALRDAGKTQRAIAVTQSLLEREAAILHPTQLLDEPAEPDGLILDLLERQTLTPHPELSAKLTELVSTRRAADCEGPLVMGVFGDGWTHDGKPGYVIVDASASPLPVSKDLWFACWADPRDFPVRMTISDGIEEDFEHTFLDPSQLRVPLPVVPPGESRIFRVKTDKAWRRPDLNDPRTLGVRISTSA